MPMSLIIWEKAPAWSGPSWRTNHDGTFQTPASLSAMQSDRDAPIYRIPKAAGAKDNVKESVDSYLNYHKDKAGDYGDSRKEGYAEVRSITCELASGGLTK